MFPIALLASIMASSMFRKDMEGLFKLMSHEFKQDLADVNSEATVIFADRYPSKSERFYYKELSNHSRLLPQQQPYSLVCDTP